MVDIAWHNILTPIGMSFMTLKAKGDWSMVSVVGPRRTLSEPLDVQLALLMLEFCGRSPTAD